jgi:hypothetical protein
MRNDLPTYFTTTGVMPSSMRFKWAYYCHFGCHLHLHFLAVVAWREATDNLFHEFLNDDDDDDDDDVVDRTSCCEFLLLSNAVVIASS